MNDSYDDRVSWMKARNILPKQCAETGEIIWPFTSTYKGIRLITGPGTPIVNIFWLSDKGYAIRTLKGKIPKYNSEADVNYPG